jgi:hypothetical protein
MQPQSRITAPEQSSADRRVIGYAAVNPDNIRVMIFPDALGAQPFGFPCSQRACSPAAVPS